MSTGNGSTTLRNVGIVVAILVTLGGLLTSVGVSMSRAEAHAVRLEDHEVRVRRLEDTSVRTVTVLERIDRRLDRLPQVNP